MAPPRHAVITISGFTQKRLAESGMQVFTEVLRQRVDDNDVLVLGPFAWNEDIGDLAGFLTRRIPMTVDPIIVSYSYGAGSTTPRLCKELDFFSRKISTWYAIDPVPRPGFWPTWLPYPNVKALRPPTIDEAITAPRNVREVIGFRQVNKRPYGRIIKRNHEAQGNGRGQLVHPTVLYGTGENIFEHVGVVASYRHPQLKDFNCRHLDAVTHNEFDNHAGLHEAILADIVSRVTAPPAPGVFS